VTEEKERVAETLADYRGNYKYNLLEREHARFNAQVRSSPNGTTTRCATMGAGRGEDASSIGSAPLAPPLPALPWNSCRGARPPAEPGRQFIGKFLTAAARCLMLTCGAIADRTACGACPYGRLALLGPKQLAWLSASSRLRARPGRLIGRDLPRSGSRATRASGWAMGRRAGANWKSPTCSPSSSVRHPQHALDHADVHYTAAHYMIPAARSSRFEPFWEFVSGPIHAGTWWPSELATRSGRASHSKKASSGSARESAAQLRAAVLRHVAIDGASEVMTVTLKDVGDAALWSIDSSPNGTQGRAVVVSSSRPNRPSVPIPKFASVRRGL